MLQSSDQSSICLWQCELPTVSFEQNLGEMDKSGMAVHFRI